MQISFRFCKTCICLKNLENLQMSVNMIDRLDITDESSVKCNFILNTVIFIKYLIKKILKMFYDFFIWPKGSEWDQRYDQP